MRSKRREACKPWYGSGMRAQPQPGEFNGEPVRRPARPAVLPVGLYRYKPVSPVYRDADGYLLRDGMGQTVRHQSQTSLWYHALTQRLPDATVCADQFLHYRKGDRKAVLGPDLFVALGVPPWKDRPSYKLWQYPVPDLAIEMLSESTAGNDVGWKRGTYAHLGVREYWLFDPLGFKLSTPLAGHWLRAGRYRAIRADAAGRLRSRVLGLDLHVQGGELRFRDPATGEDLDTYDEAVDGKAAQRNRADAQQHRAEAAERGRAAERTRAEAAERERAVEKSRADAQQHRAEAAERGRAAEEDRADGERRRADAAEREVARLRSELEGS